MEVHFTTKIKIITAVTTIIVLMISGTMIYCFLEKWDTVDSFYFTGVTLTTIGYGDIVPTTPLAKIFTVFFAFAGVGILLFSLTIVAEYVFNKRVVDMERDIKRFQALRSKRLADVEIDLKQIHKILPKRKTHTYHRRKH